MFSNIFLGPLVDEDDTAGKDQRVHRKGGGGGGGMGVIGRYK